LPMWQSVATIIANMANYSHNYCQYGKVLPQLLPHFQRIQL